MKKACLILLLTTTASGCATMFSGTSQKLAVQSEPPGANVYLDKEYKGQTPVTFQVKRKLKDRALLLRKDGYPDYHKNVEYKFNKVSLLNLFEPVGFIVDSLSGAVVKYDEKVNCTLEDPLPQAPKTTSASTTKPTLSRK